MKSTPVPHLTRRDCGELENNRPKLPRGELAHILKTYWYEGKRQGEMAKATGKTVGYIKKFTACFGRALNVPYPGWQEGQIPEKEVQYSEKKQPKKPKPKKCKSLTLNFSTPIGKRYTLRGVTKVRKRGWKAQIRVGKTVRYLGVYNTIQEAAEAYNKEAKRVYKQYAKLNETEK